MRYPLLWVIKAYWYIIPEENRRRCLFKKSCSQYVFETTAQKGFFRGMKALLYRHKHCRPGYYVIHGKEEKLLISAKNKVFGSKEISPQLLNDE